MAKERVVTKPIISLSLSFSHDENSLSDDSIFKFFVEVFLDWLNLEKEN